MSNNPKKRPRINFYLPETLREKVRAIATETGMTVSEYIRSLIFRDLKEKENQNDNK